MTPLPVVLVDDDADLRRATAQMLELEGFSPRPFADAPAALASLDESFPGCVVTDIRMPGMDGLELFSRLRALDPEIPVILVTGHGDVDLAVSAMKDGAYDFIAKPFSGERIAGTLRRALETRRLVLENRALRAMAARSGDDGPLIGEAPAIRRLREALRQIADTDVDVLVEGETGTGKEVVADLLHRWSRRRDRPFVALNCGALPETVIDAELFGFEAGAFTGAQKRRVGRIEHSGGGTLFLDEIESMPPALQVKLLRVLETRQVDPLGTNAPRRIDLRVVAAVKIDLSDPAARGDFREDLYYRLNVVTLRIPPLRERREDVPLLFGHFLRRAAERFGRPVPALSPALSRHLAAHDWPGNVRELVHFAERTVLGLDPDIGLAAPATRPAQGPDDLLSADEGLSLPERLDRHEAALIRSTLERHRGDVRRSLEALGIARKTFYDKLQRHGISRRDFE
ncbi:sigma-54 dependent transcriptional regulator [Aurantimonas sp. Leaf443]|uniref:sigma-54-dependent transcriptional regulator n=1 Tax=Aurantimonas sp. Leaf443 TaxID=1736378 RepID=UPI0006FA131D|nr:sigma-54 dependent transcriptional regulator [Aurantimonas sp. Leaf443]KQT82149.1 Fis family transcriptional regulator [Aurantimonas sp. Leaf443]